MEGKAHGIVAGLGDDQLTEWSQASSRARLVLHQNDFNSQPLVPWVIRDATGAQYSEHGVFAAIVRDIAAQQLRVVVRERFVAR